MKFRTFLLLLPLLLAGVCLCPAQTTVFINEIHYDDAGTDTLEGVEIAAPAGTDLDCYKLMFYNGGDSAVYDSLHLSGTVGDSCNGFGTSWFAFSGLQNSVEGIALVYDPNLAGCTGGGSLSVVQFLSYEGQILALDGPAAGMTSTNIGVSESSSNPAGNSLQLTGNGTFYSDFSWASAATHTIDSMNNGQTFAGACGTGPAVAGRLMWKVDASGCILPGQTFSVRVCATDASGNVDISYTDSIFLSKVSGPGNLSGTLGLPAVNGCVNFNDLSFDQAGAHLIRATDSTFADTSATVYISDSCNVCPWMSAALIDACGIEEGRNEILFFNSGTFAIPVTPEAIAISYGSTTPPATTYTGSFVSNQDYIDSLNAHAGCNVFVDAMSNAPIPPHTDFMVMNYQPGTIYDFNAWCGLGPIYVAFSNDGNWTQFSGNFKNCLDCGIAESGTNPRYFRTNFSGMGGGGACDLTYNYTPCTDLLCANGAGNNNNGDGLDFGPGGGGPTASWNECTPAGVFPVVYASELQATVVGKSVRLDWETASEQSSSHFEVLRRSARATQLISVGRVEAEGYSDRPTRYQWLDIAPLQGLSFYQLRQVDLNGDAHLSDVVAVQMEGKSVAVVWAVKGGWALESNVSGLIRLDLYDLSGRKVDAYRGPAVQAGARIKRTEILPPGIYVYRLLAGEKGVTGKLLIR